MYTGSPCIIFCITFTSHNTVVGQVSIDWTTFGKRYFSSCHQRINNVMERYNRDFNNLFDSPSLGLYVFCERVREEVAMLE
jgi:hypothetical protein